MQFTRVNLLALTATTAFTLLIATSCKKSSSTPSGAAAQLSATVGTTAYNPSIEAAFDQQSFVNIEGLMVTGGDSISLAVSIPDAATSTTITFDAAEIDYVDTKGKIGFSSFYGSSHGTITISSWDKTALKISGKFSGEIYDGTGDSTAISGQFNTPYQQF